MVKKILAAGRAAVADAQANAALSSTVRDSAQHIWLAGLGAFAKAQEGGGKVFDTLVKEGLSIQRKTQVVAEEKISEATSRMASVATGITARATGQWDKLEGIFEDRVARALNKLGVPSAKDVEVLIERIEELNRSVQSLSAESAARAATAGGKRKAAAPATSRKPAAPARKRARVKAA